jgi:MFS family permease|uniref:MFS transporter n=3 Tax=Candidatus Planktophila sp. TaxID=2175601 RepID=UPI00404B573F
MSSSVNTDAHQSRVVKTLVAAQVLNGVGVAGTVAAGSLLVASITDSETLAGLAQTFSVLGAAAMALPLARLTNRGGRRLALSAGLITGLIGSLLAITGGSTSNIYLMLLGSFLVGAASASGYQARFAAIDLATPDNRAKQLSLVVWGSTIGAVAGPNLMEPSGRIAESFGLPSLVGPYIVSATTLGLAVVVIYLFLRPDPYLTAHKDARAAGTVIKKSFRETFAYIKSESVALFAISSIAIGHLVMVAVMVMTPVHMKHVDVTLQVIGFVISIHVLGMYAFSPVVGNLTDKLGPVRVIQLGVAILLTSTVVSGTASADNAIQLGIGLFLLGIGWSCTLIAGSTLLSESVSDEMRPSSQGTSDLTMNLMGAAGGAVAGLIIGLLNYGWLCYFASIPVVALGVWSSRIKRGKHVESVE